MDSNGFVTAARGEDERGFGGAGGRVPSKAPYSVSVAFESLEWFHLASSFVKLHREWSDEYVKCEKEVFEIWGFGCSTCALCSFDSGEGECP